MVGAAAARRAARVAPRPAVHALRVASAGDERRHAARSYNRRIESGGQALIDPGEVALLAAIGFIGALIFGITGFGAALVTIPLATHLVPLKFALALFVLADLSSAIRVGFENPGKAARDEWLRLVPMILVGTALAVVPAALLGISVARRLFLKISRETLLRAVSLMLLASGGSLVWRALG